MLQAMIGKLGSKSLHCLVNKGNVRGESDVLALAASHEIPQGEMLVLPSSSLCIFLICGRTAR